MIEAKDITLDMTIYVVQCKQRKVVKSKVNRLSGNNNIVGISAVPSWFPINTLLRCLNTDTSTAPEFYGLTCNGKNRYYFSLSEKEAYRHLANNVLQHDALKAVDEVEKAHRQYTELLNKLNDIETKQQNALNKVAEL